MGTGGFRRVDFVGVSNKGVCVCEGYMKVVGMNL